MSITTNSTMSIYATPPDRGEALVDLLWYFDSLQKGEWHVQRMFGFTHPKLAAAIVSAYARGVDMLLLLDRLQGMGHSEHALIHSMMVQGFPPERMRFATSTMHQFMHAKQGACGGRDVADAQYDDWKAARKDGYPVTLDGSLNWSEAGFLQRNSLLVIPGKVLAAEVRAEFEQDWAWVDLHEPAYQWQLAKGA